MTEAHRSPPAHGEAAPVPAGRQSRLEELSTKLHRVRTWLDGSGYAAALFTGQAGVAWVTAGLEDRVSRNEEPGLVWALVDASGLHLITTNVEGKRHLRGGGPGRARLRPAGDALGPARGTRRRGERAERRCAAGQRRSRPGHPGAGRAGRPEAPPDATGRRRASPPWAPNAPRPWRAPCATGGRPSGSVTSRRGSRPPWRSAGCWPRSSWSAAPGGGEPSDTRSRPTRSPGRMPWPSSWGFAVGSMCRARGPSARAFPRPTSRHGTGRPARSRPP